MPNLYKLVFTDHSYESDRHLVEYENADSAEEALELALGRRGLSVHVELVVEEKSD